MKKSTFIFALAAVITLVGILYALTDLLKNKTKSYGVATPSPTADPTADPAADPTVGPTTAPLVITAVPGTALA